VIHQLEFQQLGLGHQQPRQQVPRQQELVLQQLVQALQLRPQVQVRVQVPRQQEPEFQQLVQALQLQVLLLLLLQQLSWQVLF